MNKHLIALVLVLISALGTSKTLIAQSCNQLEILFTAPDCFDRSNSAVAGDQKNCKEVPVCINQIYNYSSSLTGIGYTYSWTVSGPSSVTINPSSTSPAITISWPVLGIYTLVLTVTDGSGNVFTKCLTINVMPRPIANFTFTPNNVCKGSTISFTGTTTYAGSFLSSWNFDDLSSGSSNYVNIPGNGTVTHTFNNAGTYWVTLIASSVSIVTVPGSNGGLDTVIKTCCADTIKKQVTIEEGNIKIDCISTVCAGAMATYTITGCANPTVTLVGASSFTQSGNQITVVWGNGSVQGQINATCPGGCTASVPVPIIPATTVIAGNTSPCNTGSSIYSVPVLPGTFYTWTLLNTTTSTYYNSAINTYPDNNTVFINWPTIPAGTYVLGITLNNKHICCTSTGSLTITPRGKWQAFFDQTICKGSNASLSATAATGAIYNWNVTPALGVAPPSQSGASNIFNPLFNNTGIYNVQITETANKFCNSGSANPQQITVTVINAPTPGVINGPNKGCPGSTYNYAMSIPASAGFHYEWTITSGTGTFVPTVTPPVFADYVSIKWTSLPATISVVLKSNGYPACTSPIITYNVTQATIGTISGANNVCVDAEEIYTLVGGTLPASETFSWSISPASLGSVIAGGTTSTPKIKWHGMVSGSGPWTATLTATSNCGSVNYTVNIGKPPIATLSQTGNICIAPGVTITATPGFTYVWSPAAPPTNIINVTNAGIYSVAISNGACTINKTIEVKDPFAILPATCGVGFCNGANTNQTLTVQVIKPTSGSFTYQWYSGIYPGGSSVAGPITNTSLTNTYTATAPGSYYVVVTYGSCIKWVAFNVEKICCPDIANPAISTIRNSCNQFTFKGTGTGGPFMWNFGDGTIVPGTSGIPKSHTYLNAGIYCVTFCVAPPTPNPSGCVGNCAATQVIVPIESKFTYKLGCNGCLLIENNSIVIPTSGAAVATYIWNFGNGPSSVFSTTSSTPPAYCYPSAGSYSVTLTINYQDLSIVPPVGGLICSATTTPITITYAPLDFTYVPSPVCTYNLTAFTSVPNTFSNYTWNFGDTYSSYTSPTTHAYSVGLPTTYPVTLTVVDDLGNTCTKTKPVVVNPGISNCKILPAYICPGGSGTLTATAGFAAYQWQVQTSPGVFVNAPGANTGVAYNTTVAGFYRVIITNSYGCTCTSNVVEVKNVPKPKAMIQASKSNLCGSGYVSLTSINHLPGYTSEWFASSWGPYLSNSSVYGFSLAVTSSYYLVLTNQYGCKDTCQVTIYVNPIPAAPIITSSSASMCEGVPITLTVTNYATNILWNTGATTPVITVVNAGAYSATYTNPATGCSSTSTIIVKKRPSTDLFPHFCDSIKCTCRNPDGSFTVYAPKPLVGAFASTYNITWLYNGNVIGANANNSVFTPAASGSYQIILTDPVSGCKDTSDIYNVVVPPCDTCDCKESHWGDIILNQGTKGVEKTGKVKDVKTDPVGRTTKPNGQNDSNSFPPKNAKALPVGNGTMVELACKGTYELACNKPYTISANWFCKDTSCPSKITYSLQPPTGAAITGTAPATFTPTLSGTYALTLYGWCNNKICDSCIINFIVKCDTIPKDCCKGSYWKDEPYYYMGAVGTVKPGKIDCTKETVVLITGDDCKKALVVGASIQCPIDCTGIDSVFVYDGGGNIVLSGPAPLSITGLANGNYTAVINGYCGGKLCLSCKLFIKVDCKDCDCSKNEPLNIQLSINNKIKQVSCGADLGKLNCKDNIVLDGSYTCNPKDCPAKLTYTLSGTGGGSGTLPLTLSSLTPGSYSIVIQAYCNGKLCKECKLTFAVECDRPCCPYTINAQASQTTYAPNANATIVTNSFTITGIPITANITEVRANVLSYTIDDNYKGDCMKCVNLPFTWASASTATNIATAPPKITMFGGVTVPSFNGSGAGAYQNPREIIWNNGTNLNTPINTIGISFILPPTPAIDCCELKGKICVKFTFRDEKCNECEAIGCFDFVIKKK